MRALEEAATRIRKNLGRRPVDEHGQVGYHDARAALVTPHSLIDRFLPTAICRCRGTHRRRSNRTETTHMSNLLRLAGRAGSLGGLVLLAALLAPGGAASAQSLSWTDGRDDIWKMGRADPTFLPAPGETNADIRHVSIRHGAHAVVIRVSLTDLRRTGNDVVVGGTVRTDEGLVRHFQWAWRPTWSGYRLHWANRDGRTVMCDLTHAMSFADNTTYLRIPRSCLNRPRWVRVHLEGATYVGAIDTVYYDDAHSDQATGIPTHYTRRLWRG